MGEEQERERVKGSARMLEERRERRELECKRLGVEPTDPSAGSNTAAVAVAFAAEVVVVVVVDIMTTVVQCNSTWGYTPGNTVKNSCLDSFLKPDARCK